MQTTNAKHDYKTLIQNTKTKIPIDISGFDLHTCLTQIFTIFPHLQVIDKVNAFKMIRSCIDDWNCDIGIRRQDLKNYLMLIHSGLPDGGAPG